MKLTTSSKIELIKQKQIKKFFYFKFHFSALQLLSNQISSSDLLIKASLTNYILEPQAPGLENRPGQIFIILTANSV
jgi:hypothetical protein